MADKKISALTGASTPLAGTEVLPIVQSGSTVKVAVSDLTVGRAVSMASVTASNLTSGRVATVGTSGLIQDDADLQFNGQDLGVGTAPKTWAAADFYGLQVGKGIAIFGRGSGDQDRGGFTSNAYNDGSWKRIATGNAAQYYQNDGNHTLYTAVSGAADSAISWVEVAEIDEANKNFKVSAGNVVIGTSGKGIDFSATSGTGTSELLADYEEGTWTPIYLPETNSFTSITYNIQTGSYTKIGRVVYFSFSLRTASLTIGTATDALRISGLPFTVGGASQSTSLVGQSETWGGDYPSGAFARGGTQLVSMLYRTAANGGTLSIQVSDMSTAASANEISGGGFYIV